MAVGRQVHQIEDFQCRTAEDQSVGFVEALARAVGSVEQKTGRVDRLMGMLGTGGETVDATGRRDESAIIDSSAKRGVSDEGAGLRSPDVPLLPVGRLGQVTEPVGHVLSVT